MYSTKIRTTGIGTANGVGRIGGILMPWVCLSLMIIELRSPFILFGILSVLTAFLDFFLPYDTLGRELD